MLFLKLSISVKGLGIDVLLARDKNEYERQTLLPNGSVDAQSTISGIMLADFDGDVLMDVLVSIKDSKDASLPVQIVLYWGFNGTALDTGK